MLFSEIYLLRGPFFVLLQVPNLECFIFINSKEFAYTIGCISLLASWCFDHLVFFFYIRIVKKQFAPFNLCYCIRASMVPHRHWNCVRLVVYTKRNKSLTVNKKNTYHIDPHENAAKRNPLSDIEIAVGEFKPIVSILTGC